MIKIYLFYLKIFIYIFGSFWYVNVKNNFFKKIINIFLSEKHLKIQSLLHFQSPLNQRYSGILEWVDGDYHSLIFIKIKCAGSWISQGTSDACLWFV